ncbi:tyrosine-type recombinase/integrase [Helicobacter anatolicus]|uniref:tyrosine-type recombinase/integrase n=1 Tax=Helicobacter anatolicus TaxID=2905874 RepID=UPI001E3D2894|nr:tyrosine-type recombinase/integrase [Helicobacter anatolicus]MCE3037694.1 tyrosine-type recombinase/integrase [Helicobacter anatolicus]MCE3040019.1 tyrosine-type recombinase/integrase [Helicobacter anatolicus]
MQDNIFFWINEFVRFKVKTLDRKRNYIEKEQILQEIAITNKETLNACVKLFYKQKFSSLNLYSSIFIGLIEFLEKTGIGYDVRNFKNNLIVDYLFSRNDLKNSSKFLYQKLLKEFFFFMGIKKKELFNFFYLNFSVDKKIDFLNQEELKKIHSHIKKMDTKKNNTKHLEKILALKILLFTGARASEVLSIKTKEIQFSNDIVIFKILGKGNKFRNLAIEINHIQELFILFNDQREFLFTIKYPTIYKACGRLLELCNISKNKKGAHLLRHSFASFLYKKTKDILLVQRALGHSTITETQKYMHIDEEERFGKIINAFHHL